MRRRAWHMHSVGECISKILRVHQWILPNRKAESHLWGAFPTFSFSDFFRAAP